MLLVTIIEHGKVRFMTKPILSPRLVHPEEAVDFTMEIIEEDYV
jgi:hypothetical protein